MRDRSRPFIGELVTEAAWRDRVNDEVEGGPNLINDEETDAAAPVMTVGGSA